MEAWSTQTKGKESDLRAVLTELSAMSARKLIFKRKVSIVGFAELVFRVTFYVAVCLFVSVVTFMRTSKETLRNLNLCFSERAVIDFVLIYLKTRAFTG